MPHPIRVHVIAQAVIADITRRMGAGMAEYIELDEVESIAQYDHYCHYVAGLVGIGLSQMFGGCSCRSFGCRGWERYHHLLSVLAGLVGIGRPLTDV